MYSRRSVLPRCSVAFSRLGFCFCWRCRPCQDAPTTNNWWALIFFLTCLLGANALVDKRFDCLALANGALVPHALQHHIPAA